MLDESQEIQTPSSSTSSSRTQSVVMSTPTRHNAALSDKFEFAFRACLLGDAQSCKKLWNHSIVYGKYSHAAALEDAILEQASG